MSRRRRRAPDVREIVRQELGKALALPTGAVTTPVSQAYLARLGRPNGSGTPAAALSRDPYDNIAFGPGVPLFPAPIDPPLASGRPAPRRSQFPVSVNLETTPARAVPFGVLRDVADQVSVIRACIETRKAGVTGLEWSFGIDSTRARHLAKRTGRSDYEITADLRDKYADDMDRLHQWWAKPDRINNWTFSEWLGALLEDELVLDAVAIYPHLSLGGDLLALELIDASTIKPLLDHRGAAPQPPLAAFQQILWGFPRGEFSQSPPEQVDAEFVSAVYGRVDGVGAATDALIYKVRNRRMRSPYGFSCTEQAVIDVDLWLKRFEWLRSEYTAGVTPEMIVKVDAAMTPEQMRAYEAVFNDELSGRTTQRHRARFLPQGFDPSYPADHDSKFSSDFDLHLIRLMCAAFSVLPTSLGFTPNHGMGGMGGQGHQQGEADSQLERGTKPTAQWLTDLVNEVSTAYLGMPPEVTFKFHGLDTEDEQKDAALLQGYVNGGLTTLNEGRDQLSLPRYTFPEANQPLLVTPTGPAWLNVDVQPTGVPGNLPSAAQNQPGYTRTASEPGPPVRDEAVQDVPDEPMTKAAAEDARQERRAFLAFAGRRVGTGRWRDFQFTYLDPVAAQALNRLAEQGDVNAVRALFALVDR
jgi:hypothetical protein